MLKVSRVLLVVCALGFSVSAQSPPSPQVDTATSPGKIASYFNAEKNTTTVVLGFSDVGGESPCGLYFSVSGFHQGKTAAPANKINLVMMRITPEEKIKSAPLRDLTFTFDNETMSLGLMETASQQSIMDLRLETLQIAVPFDSFLKIANAKSVEAKLGLAKFTLTETNLNNLRQFVTRFKS